MKNFMKTILSAMKSWTKEEIKKEINNVPVVIPDWNENNPNSINYIKNRTHWEKVEEIFSVENAVFDGEFGEYFFEQPVVITEGKTYIVNWDGIEYICGAYVIDDFSVIGGTEFGGNNEPFYIAYSKEENIAGAMTGSPSTHTFSIKESEIQTIPPKYIKDMYYDNGTIITEVLPETTIEGFGKLSDSFYTVENAIKITPEVGMTYVVNWDGTEYITECKRLQEDAYIGNLNYLGGQSGGDIPFLIVFYFDGNFIVVESPDFSHTISITEVKHDLKQLDTKYLPIMEKTTQTMFEMNDITGEGVFETSTDKILIGEHLVTIDGVSETLNFVFVESEQFSFTQHSLGDIESFCEDGKYGIYLEFQTSDITHSVKIEKINNFIKEEYLPPELNKEQYIPTTERITAEVGQTIVVEEIDEEGRPASWKAIDRNKFDAITLIDEVNNCEYIVKMKNGTLTSICKTSKISVVTMPTRTEYFPGEPFDPTGMVVVGVCQDGTTYEIDMSTYTPPVLETPFSISYTEAGITYVAAIDLTMLSLIDFNYTSQPDGTYKIDGWKGTLNGEPSTELVVPNSPLIII